MNKNEINIDGSSTIKIPKIKNFWIITTIILTIICLFLFYNYLNSNPNPNKPSSLSGEEAGQKIANYLSTRMEEEVQYVSYDNIGDLYEITVSYKEENVPVFITKDGEYFVQAAIPIIDDISP